MNLLEDNRFNHQPQVIKGAEAQCSDKLKTFQGLRKRNKWRKAQEAKLVDGQADQLIQKSTLKSALLRASLERFYCGRRI